MICTVDARGEKDIHDDAGRGLTAVGFALKVRVERGDGRLNQRIAPNSLTSKKRHPPMMTDRKSMRCMGTFL